MLIRQVALAHVLSILSFHTSRRREKPLGSKLRRGSFFNPQTFTKLDGRFAFPSRTVKQIQKLNLTKRARAHDGVISRFNVTFGSGSRRGFEEHLRAAKA